MTTFDCIWRVAACGAVGGLVGCFHKEAVLWPRYDKASKVLSPGMFGNMVVGAFAAFLIWCLDGPAASVDIAAATVSPVSLTIRELGTSGLVGFCGGRVLTVLAQKDADHVARGELSNSLKNIVEKLRK